MQHLLRLSSGVGSRLYLQILDQVGKTRDKRFSLFGLFVIDEEKTETIGQFYKKIMSVIYKCLLKARVFVTGKPF